MRVVHFVRAMPGWLRLTALVTILFCGFLFVYIGVAHADTQGPNSPGAAADNSGVGSVAWSTPSNALTSNATYTSASLGSSAISHYLFVTNFGFTIAAGSTINGIVAEVQENATTNANAKITDNSILPIKAGATGGTSQATTSTWPSSNGYVTYGSSSNLWGQTWAPSDVDATNFGIAISAKNVKVAGSGATLTANIDYVRVTIYFTPPPVVYGQASFRVFGNQDASTSVTYVKTWGGTGTDQGNSVVQTSDGGYAVTGQTKSYGDTTNGDMFLAKYDSSGNLSWSRTWGGTGNDAGRSVIQTSDGGYAVAGQTTSFGGGGYDMFLAKYDSSGNLSWSRTWGGTGNDYGKSVVQTSDGGYAVTGQTLSYGDATNGDMFLADYDSTGNPNWSEIWGGTGADSGNSVIQTSDGGYAVTGQTGSFGAGGADVFLAKYDSSGNPTWSRTWGGTGNDYGYSVVQASDGGYAVTGQTFSYGDTANGDMLLIKYDSSGATSWSRTWGGTGSEVGNSFVQTSDGGYAVTGQTSSFGAGFDMFLVKYDSSGTLSWSRTWGGTNSEDGLSVVQSPDGGYAVTGDTYSYGDTVNGDMFLAKYDSTGNMANCTTACTSPTATTSSPIANTTSPTATTSSPIANTTSPTATTSSPIANTTTAVAISPSSIDVGTPLAAQNTAATIPADSQPFRMRIDIGITNYQLGASVGAFKLQYAPMTTSCDAAFTNTPSSAYKDVNDTSTIRYYDNTTAVSGLLPSTNANDPTDSTNTLVRQAYREKGTTAFSNPVAIPVGQDGMWDFALTAYHTLQNTHYCLRVVLSSGTALNTYTTASSGSAVAEIITPSASYTQGGYRMFQKSSGMPTFLKAWGSTGADQANSVAQTSDGGYAVTGETKSYGDTANGDMFLAKYDSSGTLSWSRTWGGTGTDVGNSVVQTSDGGYAVTGQTYSFNDTANGDMFLVKYDSNGNLSGCVSTCWQSTWGGSTVGDYGTSVVQTSDGGYAVTGTTSFGIILVKYTSAGVVSWNVAWGGTGGSSYGNTVVQTSDGGYAVTGYTDALGNVALGGNMAVLVKFSSTGTVSWQDGWGSGSADYAQGLVQTSDGGYAVTGYTQTYGDGSGDMFISKFNSSGSASWYHTWGGTGTDWGYAVVQASDGGYAITGETDSFGAGNQDVALVKYDSSGNLVWNHTWGGSGADVGSSIVKTTDGGYAVAGYTASYGGGGNDAFLAKYDSAGGLNGCSSACSAPTAPTTNVSLGPSSMSGDGNLAVSGIATTLPSATVSSPGATSTTVLALASSAAVGSPLVNQNVPYDASKTAIQFRLRLDIDVSNSGVAISGQSFKLQYALRGSDNVCDAGFAGETYADVTTSTPVYYYVDPGNTAGNNIISNANDPVDGTNTVIPQTYQDSNNFTNGVSLIYANQSGEWDFSLAILAGTLASHDYCLRVVTSSGTALGAYNQIAEVAYGPLMPSLMRQEAWWSRSGVRQNFFIKGQ